MPNSVSESCSDKKSREGKVPPRSGVVLYYEAAGTVMYNEVTEKSSHEQNRKHGEVKCCGGKAWAW